MAINRNPYAKTSLPPKMQKYADDNALVIALVTCYELVKGKPKMESAIQFFSTFQVCPKIGETIVLEDMKRCVVENVYHGLHRKPGVLTAALNVACALID